MRAFQVQWSHWPATPPSRRWILDAYEEGFPLAASWWLEVTVVNNGNSQQRNRSSKNVGKEKVDILFQQRMQASGNRGHLFGEGNPC